MTLTLLNLYNECASQPWSMYDSDAETIDDIEAALKISINKAISYLWNLQDWSFRLNNQTIKAKTNRASYSMPNGNILKKTIKGVEKYYVRYNNSFLDYIYDIDSLEEDTGEPEYFYIENDTLYLYPTPDDSYTISVKYLLFPYGLSDDGEQVNELTEDDDYINIPEKYETLFKNCVISLAMMYAIADESDENYSGYKKQYEDALGVLDKYCKNSVADRYVRW